jgi:hypothetical protein
VHEDQPSADEPDPGHDLGRVNEITRRGFIIDDLATGTAGDGADRDGPRQVTVTLHVHGRNPGGELAGALSELDYVDAVVASDLDAVDE